MECSVCAGVVGKRRRRGNVRGARRAWVSPFHGVRASKAGRRTVRHDVLANLQQPLAAIEQAITIGKESGR